MVASGSQCLEVAAPSRLHVGLLSFGTNLCPSERSEESRAAAGKTARGALGEGGDARQYGGAGVMVEKPGLLLRFSAGERLMADGPGGERAMDFARRFAVYHHLAEEPRCRIEVARLPRQHVGLGVGTSLGMSVAAGLAAWLGLPPMSAEQLAISVGRGRRSAVGVHGFLHGGLIVEGGKAAGETLSPLLAHVELPDAWRFVLIIPAGEGVSGQDEEEAFRRLPSVPAGTTAALREEMLGQLLPAAQRGDFEAFAESLYRFNRAAGECYAAYQGGPYATRRVAELVAAIRAEGIRGVGQSSWGPTIYTLFPHQSKAESFVEEFASHTLAKQAEWIITPPSRRGATLR